MPADEKPAEVRLPLPCVDDDGRVAAWVCCKTCRYNLFGLDPHRNCPECGTPIAASTAPSLVRSMPRMWLVKVRHSVGLVRIAIGAVLLIPAVLFFARLDSLLWLAAGLFVLSALSVFAAGFVLAHADERACTQHIRDRRADFTDSLIVGPVLVPLLLFLIGLLVPSIFSSRESAIASTAIEILAFATSLFLFWLCVLVALRPITTLTRFLAVLFEHGSPMNADRTGTVLGMAGAVHWLASAAIVLALLGEMLDVRNVSQVAADLAGLAAKLSAALGAIALVISLAVLYWLLCDVRTALAVPIVEAKLRDGKQEVTDSA